MSSNAAIRLGICVRSKRTVTKIIGDIYIVCQSRHPLLLPNQSHVITTSPSDKIEKYRTNGFIFFVLYHLTAARNMVMANATTPNAGICRSILLAIARKIVGVMMPNPEPENVPFGL